jgi:hypothetical protein
MLEKRLCVVCKKEFTFPNDYEEEDGAPIHCEECPPPLDK